MLSLFCFFAFAALVAALVSAEPLAKSVLNGDYSDPNHPSCQRTVEAQSQFLAVIKGADAAGGEGASCDGTTDVAWEVPAVLDALVIVANFSSKGGPENLTGKYGDVGAYGAHEIRWEDGNVWPKL
ncbi:hypothetical protein B484DRAFT_443413, partial [Ochromonadaceae sp. CCMP2298]|mmetsp:Transcript_34695/g.75010  ORF Transcript_34695/g.75010 Transcript_34695/m.75010 type:complete len:126 (-) Transcript_34695:169-546(-)